jgi:hypothetical protein
LISNLIGRPMRAVAAVLAALLAVAAVAIPLAAPANADTTPSTTTTATVSGGSAVTYTGPQTPVSLPAAAVDQAIHVHVARTGSANVFGIQIRICKSGVNVNNQTQFSPGLQGWCVPGPLDALSNDVAPSAGLQPAGDAPTNTFADLDFIPGTGTTNFASIGKSFPDFTCGVGNPCQLVVRESTSDTPGDNYISYQLNYQAAATAPAAPAAPNAVAGPGDGTVTVSLAAAPSDGGSPITDYIVTPYIGGVAQAPVDTHSTSLSWAISGLTDFTAYTFSVHAVNAVGPGAESPQSGTATPAPAAAVVTGASAGNGQATVMWSAAGGSPTNYTVASVNSAVPAQPNGTCGPVSALTCVVTGLSNGTTYQFVVTAHYTGGVSVSAAGPTPGVTPIANFGSVLQTFTVTRPAGTLQIGEACSFAAGGTPGVGGAPGPDATKPWLGAPSTLAAPYENCNVALPTAVYDPVHGWYASSGAIDQVTVRDQRDTDVGWHVDASLTNWTGTPSGTFAACNTGFIPTAAGDGVAPPYTQSTTAGAPVAPDCTTPLLGYGSTHTVMSATGFAAGPPPSGGLGDSELNGNITVHIPLSAPSGTYSAVMTFTVFTN